MNSRDDARKVWQFREINASEVCRGVYIVFEYGDAHVYWWTVFGFDQSHLKLFEISGSLNAVQYFSLVTTLAPYLLKGVLS